VDPATLAAGAIALLTAYLTKAGEEFAGEGGKAAWRLAGRLLDRLRTAFQDRPRERRTIENFSHEPSGSAATAQEMLERALEQDSELSEEIDRILREVKRLGPGILISQHIEEAERVIGLRAGNIRSGSVEVNQEIGKGKDITGIEFTGDIG
jgi:hypothetical protein